MKKERVRRDKKAKTLRLAGIPKYETVNGRRYLVYSRKYGMAIIKHPEKEKYGLVNMFNEVVFDTDYDFCCYPKRGIVFLLKKGLWGLGNCKGKVLCPCNYNQIYSFKNGVAITRKGQKYGLIIEDGRVILKPKYTREQVLWARRYNKLPLIISPSLILSPALRIK